jgi:hypothetical protein
VRERGSTRKQPSLLPDSSDTANLHDCSQGSTVEGYRSCSFDGKTGSQFHHDYVSLGPPIIPDGRITRVRFETLAFRP